MLERLKEYQALPENEKRDINRRLMKVYVAHRHPERAAKLRQEIKMIAEELRATNPKRIV